MKQIYHKYLRNNMNRTIIGTAVSFLVTSFTGIGNLILGIYLGSIWFIANAVYYFVLSITRGHSLKKYNKIKKIKNREKQYEIEFSVYKHNGYLLCFLSIAYWGICMRMFIDGDSTVYKGYIVFLIATIAFSNLGLATHGLISTRKLKSPIISSLKVLSYAEALASIVITECTLLSMKENANAAKNSAITGIIFSIFILIAGITMIIKKKQTNHEKTNS